MTRNKPKLKLGVFLNPTGHHVAAWRHPESQPDAGVNLNHYVELAKTAERGKLDLIFLADNLSVRRAHIDALRRSAQYIANFEPFTLLSALSTHTKHVGLVATASTSFNEPYHVARKFASLDHLSGGRAGWNLVTSGQAIESRNFNREEHYEHAVRYRRAREFADVVLQLWDSWEEGAFVRDVAKGEFFDPAKMHSPGHKGEFFSVAGALNVARTPQGRPVIVEAGSSPDMIETASAYAEVIFCSNVGIKAAQEFYGKLKERTEQKGRERAQILLMPGLSYMVGRTEAEAKAKADHLQSLVHPIVAREILAGLLGGIDLSPYPMDGPLPDEIPGVDGSKAVTKQIYEMARRDNLTIAQTALHATWTRIGQAAVIGTAKEIADHIEEWWAKDACDGFNLMPPYFPGAFNDFIDLVVPELQKRGIFRTEYEGTTLRANLGLPVPPNRYTEARKKAEGMQAAE